MVLILLIQISLLIILLIFKNKICLLVILKHKLKYMDYWALVVLIILIESVCFNAQL